MDSNPHWLNSRRLNVYPKLFIGLYALITLGWALSLNQSVDANGGPLGYDFITFWGASYLWWNGNPADAYTVSGIFDAEKAAVPALKEVFAWFYPPTFYLVVIPLATLPYMVAFLGFVATTLAFYVGVLRKLARTPQATLLIVSFPGIYVNAFHGQNAFLTGGLIGTALLVLKRRPIVAGACMGALVVKPHLAVLIPLALICSGSWRTLASAAATALALTVLSVVCVGVDASLAFAKSIDLARSALESGALPWIKMPTVFAMLRLLGVGPDHAYAAHALVAIFAAASVILVWRAKTDYFVQCAALVTGTLLISPYLYDYDLAWLGMPIAILAVHAMRTGWLPGEKEVLVAAWLAPLLTPVIAKAMLLQVGPVVTGSLLLLTLRPAFHRGD